MLENQVNGARLRGGGPDLPAEHTATRGYTDRFLVALNLYLSLGSISLAVSRLQMGTQEIRGRQHIPR